MNISCITFSIFAPDTDNALNVLTFEVNEKLTVLEQSLQEDTQCVVDILYLYTIFYKLFLVIV